MRRLTVGLLATYKRINEIYYINKKKKSKQKARKPHPWDDKDNNYVVTVGERFVIENGKSEYAILRTLGKGSFGVVVGAKDCQTNELVAIKIIKGHKAFAKQAQTEVRILEYLNKYDSQDHQGIVRLLKKFTYRDHVCLVFEMLSCNLYDLLKNTQFHGVSLRLIRKFAYQLLHSLSFLRSKNVIHCDLKPENILLHNHKSSRIKVIDFGSSCFGDQQMYKYIQSRFYRSPEIILGVPYGVAIDMWSLGCILVEMHTGAPLFSGRDEQHHIRLIMERLGPPPPSVLAKASASKLAKLSDVFELVEGEYRPKQVKRAACLYDHIVTTVKGRHDTNRSSMKSFCDLLDRMLQYDDNKRITPQQAMKHPFFSLVHSPATAAPPVVASSGGGNSAQCDASTQTNKRIRTEES